MLTEISQAQTDKYYMFSLEAKNVELQKEWRLQWVELRGWWLGRCWSKNIKFHFERRNKFKRSIAQQLPWWQQCIVQLIIINRRDLKCSFHKHMINMEGTATPTPVLWLGDLSGKGFYTKMLELREYTEGILQ